MFKIFKTKPKDTEQNNIMATIEKIKEEIKLTEVLLNEVTDDNLMDSYIYKLNSCKSHLEFLFKTYKAIN